MVAFRNTFLAVVLLLALCGTAAQADILFSTSFPSAALPAGWTRTNINGATTFAIRNTPVFSSPSGGYYLAFDDPGFGTTGTFNNTTMVSPVFSCVGRTSVYLRLTEYWKGVEFTHGIVEYSIDGGTSWTIKSDYSLTDVGTSAAAPATTTHNFTAELAGQSNCRIRFRYNDTGQSGQVWYIDDIYMYAGPDVGVTALVAPASLACGATYGATQAVTVRIYNYSVDALTNIPVTCEITGGLTTTLTGTYTGAAIASGAFADFTFASTVDLSAEAVYHFRSYTTLAGDAYYTNDTLLTGIQQRVQTYTYSTNFNLSDGGWRVGGGNANRYFQWGALPGSYLGGAGGQGNSFRLVVNDQGYNGEVWVESPVFDLSNSTNPMLYMDIKYDLGYGGTNWVRVDYSINGGAWTTLGTNSDLNWYGIDPSSSSTGWGQPREASPVNTWTRVGVRMCNVSGESCVKFRVTTFTLFGNSGKEFAFDNFHISPGGGNDVEPLVIYPPASGTCAGSGWTAAEPVSIIIRNNTCRQLTNIPVSLNLTGAATQTLNEVAPGPIPRFSCYRYTFTGTLNMSAVGDYNLQATTNLVTDTFPSNNSITETRLGKISAFPWTANFDTDNNGFSTNRTNCNRYWERGALPGSYLGGAGGNGSSWRLTVNDQGYNGEVWVESPEFNFSAATNPSMYFDMKYDLGYGGTNWVRVEYSTNGGGAWTVLGTNSDPQWYGIDPNSTSTGWGQPREASPLSVWTKVQHTLCNLAGQSCVKFRITTNTLFGNSGKEFAFDNFQIRNDPTQDVGVTAYLQPVDVGCLFSSAQQVEVRVQNWSCSAVSNIPIVCQVTGAATATLTGTVPGPIAAGSSATYIIPGSFNMTTIGTYNFTTYTDQVTEAVRSNDTLRKTINVAQLKVVSYPYTEDFNGDNGYWISGRSNTGNNNRDFIWGALPGAYLGGPSGEGESWRLVVNDQGYNGEVWVQSPVIDLSTSTNPYLSFDMKYDLGYGGTNWVRVDYSINGGSTWATLGTNSDPQWYSIDPSSTSTGWGQPREASPLSVWTRVQHDLCVVSGEPCVKFRITTATLFGNSGKEFAFDNFKIGPGGGDDVEPLVIYPPASGTCAGSGWTAAEPVSIIIRNNTCRAMSNIPVTLNLTGAATQTLSEVAPGPIPRFSCYRYTFTGTLNMSAVGSYNLEAVTGLVSDTFPGNNSITETRLAKINTYPWTADFNTNNNGFSTNRTNCNRYWERAALPGSYLGGAGTNGSSWRLVVNDQGYNGEVWVESPEFDFTGLTNPSMYFDMKYDLGYGGTNWVRVEYSTNGGGAWTVLGTNSEPLWYGIDPNSTSTGWGQPREASPLSVWTKVQHTLCNLAGNSCVKFRITTNTLFGNSGKEFAFDNFQIRDVVDVGVTAYIRPAYSGCLYSATQQVEVRVWNWSCAPATNLPIVCQITGAATATLTGTVPGPIAANSSVTYTLPGTFDMTPAGTYNFATYTDVVTEAIRSNDTLRTSLNVLQPKIVSFPYTQNFNGSAGYWLAGRSNTGNNNRDFVHGALPGGYLGGPGGQGDSWRLVVNDQGYNGEVWAESPVFDFTGLTNPILNFDMKYDLGYGGTNWVRVEYSINGGAFTALGTNSEPQWYGIDPNSTSTGWGQPREATPLAVWTHVQHTLCNLAGQSCVKFRVTTNTLFGNSGKEFAFDNVVIRDQATADVGVTSILTPVQQGCYYPTPQSVQVRVWNWHCSSVSNVPVTVNVTGAVTTTLTGTVPGPIAANSYVDYTLPGTVTMTTVGAYNFAAYTTLAGDPYINNDTSRKTINVLQQIITSYPYLATFDGGAEGWLASGSNTGNVNRYFTVGALPYLNGPEGNGSSWYLVVNDQGYNGEVWAESPVFNFTGLTNPVLSMDIKFHLGYGGTNWVRVDYSTNGGSSWATLGTNADPEWYSIDPNSTSTGWGQPIDPAVNVWTIATKPLCSLAGQPCVKFRVTTFTLFGNSGKQFAFDNFHITNTPIDARPTATAACYGSTYNIDVTVQNKDWCPGMPTINALTVNYDIDGTTGSQTFNALNIAAGTTGTVSLTGLTIPTGTSVVKLWVNSPNALTDQIFENDTIYIYGSQLPNCNDHCSNAIQLYQGTTTAAQTRYATEEALEDPAFGSCAPAVTIENTVWYYFETIASTDPTTVTFHDIDGFPSNNGIQVEISKVSGSDACTPGDRTSVFCSNTGTEATFAYGPISLDPSSTYMIGVDGFANNNANFNITLEGPVYTFPIEDMRLHAMLENHHDARLYWNTRNEVNNKGFHIQHLEGGTFRTIGWVNGRGNAPQGSYQHYHRGLQPGMHYYRLLQQDFDGTGHYSNTVALAVGLEEGSFALSSPYLQAGQLQVPLSLSSEAATELRLITTLGQELYTERIDLPAGAHTLQIPMSGLAKGVYIVQVGCMGQTQSQRYLYIGE